MGDPSLFCWMAARYLPKMARGAASAHRDQNAEVNFSRQQMSSRMTPSACPCAEERGTYVSAERNATLFWLNTVLPIQDAPLARPQSCSRLRWNFALPDVATMRLTWKFALPDFGAVWLGGKLVRREFRALSSLRAWFSGKVMLAYDSVLS